MTDVTCYIALGSNLKKPRQQLDNAFSALSALPASQLIKKSSLYRSKAIGPGTQPDYLNAVCKLDTRLDAFTLLSALQHIEIAQGRVRTAHWGPRTLDLDLLLFGNELIDSPNLHVPHPRMFTRNFVLYPLYEIAADLVLPRSPNSSNAVTLASLLKDVNNVDLERLDTES